MKYWERPFGLDKPETIKVGLDVIKGKCKGYCPKNNL